MTKAFKFGINYGMEVSCTKANPKEFFFCCSSYIDSSFLKMTMMHKGAEMSLQVASTKVVTLML